MTKTKVKIAPASAPAQSVTETPASSKASSSEETKNIQDSLSQLERDKYMQSVDSEIDAKNKLKSLESEAEIKNLELKQSRYLTWALIGLSILLLLIAIISFMYYRQNKLKSEREKIKLEQESIQQKPQMDLFSSSPEISEQTPQEHPAITLLGEISPDELSPRQALDKLYQLKKMVI